MECERRASERLQLARPCKLYVPRIGRYLAGATWNVSSGGALIQLEYSVPLEPGDRIYMGVAFKRSQAVFSSDDMKEAGVVRVVPTADDSIALAIRFMDEAHEVPERYQRAA